MRALRLDIDMPAKVGMSAVSSRSLLGIARVVGRRAARALPAADGVAAAAVSTSRRGMHEPGHRQGGKGGGDVVAHGAVVGDARVVVRDLVARRVAGEALGARVRVLVDADVQPIGHRLLVGVAARAREVLERRGGGRMA